MTLDAKQEAGGSARRVPAPPGSHHTTPLETSNRGRIPEGPLIGVEFLTRGFKGLKRHCTRCACVVKSKVNYILVNSRYNGVAEGLERSRALSSVPVTEDIRKTQIIPVTDISRKLVVVQI
jgi:hypothetical protein